MKEILTRSIFGAIFLLYVFTPYYLDLVNNTNLFNIVLFTFSMFGTYECFQMANNTPYKSKLLIPALLLNTALFLPLLVETIKGLYPQVHSTSTWIAICNYDVLLIVWILFLACALIFILLIFKKASIQAVFKFPLLLSLAYAMLPLFVLGIAMTQSNIEMKLNLFSILIVIYVNDTFAFLSGKFFGKHKLIPSVSPKKTWEGFIGGMLVAALTISLLKYFIDGSGNNYVFIIGVSFSISILATLGDLFESKLKRAAEVKDSGKVIPGHGGVLDRIDAMLFTAPILYVLLTTIL
ncbi:MAG: phosphatidate cytidylyltransferase [Fluviicola sp.]|nr:phosphatidate cytidylyltransferase [Fluviicola sp.]